MAQQFTFTASSPAGYADLYEMQVIIGSSLSGQGSCYFYYLPASKMIGLPDSSGTWRSAILGKTPPDSLPSNSQCSLDVGHTSTSFSGNQVTLTVPVTFQPSYTGQQTVYLIADENLGLTSQWLPVGTWTVGAAPSLSITSTHTGNFSQGQPGTYILTVTNAAGTQSTSGQVTVTEALPSGLTLTSIAGSGWTCSGAACTRADALAAGASYPPITATVGVASNASSPLTNTVTVSGGGSASNSANDLTYIAGDTPDGHRTGLKSTGAYWGAAPEQIDLLSGNLNFSLPILQIRLRSTATIGLQLSYNSQMWRKDTGTPTLLAKDTGFGLGWTLQVGSLLPVGSSPNSYYIFTDTTGAQYRLDQNNSGVWTSRDGTYAAFVPATQRLYFTDGTFWRMDVTSAPGEPDAGTVYPSLIQGSNGNQIVIQYAQGSGGGSLNTSGRITQITDGRIPMGAQPPAYPCYQFNYSYLGTGDAIPHLTGINNYIGTVETYTFAYGANRNLAEPFGLAPFGAAVVLQTVTTAVANSYGFQYASGTGELTAATTPLGGILGWGYRTNTYTGSGWSYREVSSRTISPAPGTTYSWTITTDNNPTMHSSAVVADLGANTSKVWTFGTSGSSLGFCTSYQERDGGGAALLRKDYTWTQNGNPYVSFVLTTQYQGTNQVQSQTTQTLDSYGNVTQSQIFDYGNLSSPARTYNSTYLSDPNYTNLYIRNRLLTATVTPAGELAIPLVTNVYDNYWDSCAGGLNLRNVNMQDATYASTSFIYRGNVTRSDSPGGRSYTGYETSGVAVCFQQGPLVVSSAPSSATNYSLPGVLTPNGNTNLSTSFSYSNSWAVTSVSSPNGATVSTTYDGLGRPSSSTIPDGATTNYTYTYAGVSGATASTQTATLGDTSKPGYRWKKTTLDGFGRVTRVTTGHDNQAVSQVDSTYAPCACSPLGKLQKTSQPYQPNSDGSVPSPDPRLWTIYAYDASGRTTSVTAPDGSLTRTEYLTTYGGYTGNLVRVTDSAGKWKIQQSDVFGNLIRVIEPDPANGPNLLTNYAYSGLNQLITVSMPRANGTQTRSFVYSGTDMVSATNPENGTVTYQYDALHHVTQRTDAMGQQTHYSYDSYGRLTDVSYWVWVTHYGLNGPYQTLEEIPRQHVSYAYDANPLDSNYSQNTWGRLAAVQFHDTDTVTGQNLSYQYAYNTAGRVTKQRLTHDLTRLDLTAAYTWDSEGRMTSLAYPQVLPQITPPNYSYAFDTMGRLGTVTQNATQVASASYGVAGELLGLNYFGTSMNYTYNNMFQLTRITSGLGMDMTYNYTAGQNNGRIASSVDAIAGETVNYTYDVLNRLASATATNGSWGQAFTYDGFGNLTQKTATAGTPPIFSTTYDPATNHQVGQSYDANGNLRPEGAAYDTYDIENRLIQQTLNAQTFRYTYDPKGKRVIKEYSSSQLGDMHDVYFYGIGGQKLATVTCNQKDTDANPNCYTVSYNTYFGGKLIVANGVTVATDRLGSVRANSNGEHFSYYPYGEEKTSTADGRDKFATYFRDTAGQDYADQRYYAPGSGRFFTADPGGIATANAGVPTSWNRYAYVQGNPVSFYDPTGKLQASPDPNCGPGWMTDASLSGPCAGGNYDNGDGWDGGGGGGGGSGGGGGYCGGNYFNPAPDPSCYEPPPPPTPGWGDSSCSISVAKSGTPRDGQNAVGQSDYSPTSNTLGPYSNNLGWFFQVQIQVNLFGDTDPSHWTIGQSASYSGFIRLSNGASVPWNQSLQPDGPSLASVIDKTHSGQINWLDNPGQDRFPLSRSLPVIGGDVTFNFQSWAWHGDTSCSVSWSLHWVNGRFL